MFCFHILKWYRKHGRCYPDDEYYVTPINPSEGGSKWQDFTVNPCSYIFCECVCDTNVDVTNPQLTCAQLLWKIPAKMELWRQNSYRIRMKYKPGLCRLCNIIQLSTSLRHVSTTCVKVCQSLCAIWVVMLLHVLAGDRTIVEALHVYVL